MPKTTKRGDAIPRELPGTLRKSDTKAQRTFAEAHDAALARYGEESRAHRVAYNALKHNYERVGDHWEPREHHGPPGELVENGGPNAHDRSAEGVDAHASKKHLMDIARRLDIPGRSTMAKNDLVSAIRRANRRAHSG